MHGKRNHLLIASIISIVFMALAIGLVAGRGRSRAVPTSAAEAASRNPQSAAQTQTPSTNARPAANVLEAARASGAATAGSQETPQPASAGAQGLTLTVKRGDSVTSLARHYLGQSVYLRESEFESAIRQANGLAGDRLKPAQPIVIPGLPAAPIRDKPVPVPKDFEARGIYLTAFTAGSARGLDLVKQWKQAGGNTVVFDIKDYDGDLHVPFDHKYAPHPTLTIHNLPKYIHYLHSLGLHSVARIALFRDQHLAETYPQLAVRSRRTGKPWLENGKLAWTDPSNPEVQQYDLDLARMAAAAGVDEVQFDYVRFPAEGDQADCQFAFQKDHPDWPRSRVITDFVARAEDDLHARGVLFSIDVFGVMAWARPVDLNHTGQNIAELAHHLDVLSPMIYPSHFFGMDGYALPGDAPEHFISESMKRFATTTQGSGVVLRPWLQAFSWRTKTYSTDYILTQVRVAKDEGGVGFLFWHARNEYPRPFDAMPIMLAAHDRYFRGPETGHASATAVKAPAPASSPAPGEGTKGAGSEPTPSGTVTAPAAGATPPAGTTPAITTGRPDSTPRSTAAAPGPSK